MATESTKIALKYENNEYSLEHSLFSESQFKINASIVSFSGRYWCSHRSNNLDKDNHNYLTELNDDLTNNRHMLFVPENGNTAFEDVRLFVFRNQLMAIYTYLPYVLGKWVDRFSIGIGVVNIHTGLVLQQQELIHYSKRFHEKNWIPFIENDKLFIITDFDPYFRILEAEGEIGHLVFNEIYLATEKTMGWEYGEMRGGTPFISNMQKKSKWQYSFVHSSIHVPNGTNFIRFYVSTVLRFCLSELKFEFLPYPVDYSKSEKDPLYPLIWRKSSNGEFFRVIFPMGIVNYDEGVLVSYGKDDCVSRLSYFSWDLIYRLFGDVYDKSQ